MPHPFPPIAVLVPVSDIGLEEFPTSMEAGPVGINPP
jgi:hypothetical protein